MVNMTEGEIFEHQRRVAKRKQDRKPIDVYAYESPPGVVYAEGKAKPEMVNVMNGPLSVSVKAKERVEAKLQQKAIDYIQGQHGYFVIRNQFGKRTRAIPGTPDLVFAIAGHMVCIELKTADGKFTEDQARVMAKLKENGALVRICRSFEEVVEVVKEAEAET